MMIKILEQSQRLRTEERADAASTATTSFPIASSPEAMPTLPDKNFSDTTEDSSILISTLSSNKPVEDITSVTEYTPSESTSAYYSSLLETYPSELPIEEHILVLHSKRNQLSPSG